MTDAKVYWVLYDPATGALVQKSHGQAITGRAGLAALEITAEQFKAMDLAANAVRSGQLVELPADERDQEPLWAQVRALRSARLKACDWVVVRAMESGQPVPAPWATYRQALRDITNQPDPTALNWPTPPES